MYIIAYIHIYVYVLYKTSIIMWIFFIIHNICIKLCVHIINIILLYLPKLVQESVKHQQEFRFFIFSDDNSDVLKGNLVLQAL